MLYCEIGHASAQAIEDLAVFVSQLNALGLNARVDVRSVPQGLHRNLQFDIAPFLADRAPSAADRVAVVAADRLSDQKLVDLRRIFGRSGAACVALGAFGTRQAEISVSAKLSYVFGQDPELHDVPPIPGLDHHARSGCPVFGVPCPATSHEAPRVLLVGPELEERAQVRALAALAISRHFRVTVLTDAKTKQGWIDAHGMEVPIFQYGECLPVSLASRAEICVLFTPSVRYRMQSLLANLAAGGVALIDGTEARAFAGKTDAFISGPIDLTTLAPYLQLDILPNLALISQQVRTSALFRQCSAGGVLRTLTGGAPSPVPAPRRPDDVPARVVFMPTNGVGLGHAQRCSLIASELDLGRVRPAFAAFPSCVPLIKSHGFDVAPLISRSEQHAQSHENDLANYLRLRALTAGAGALVFDGVYVFDSIFRSILENRVPGVWIRRGLWQPGQDNANALDREKAFARVIVPSEAFEELNQSYSRGEHLRVVGPIVRPAGLAPEARAALRGRLADAFGRPFDRLVVTLLGAGVAVDRSAETQALCGMTQRRNDVLHLVVVWPGATLQPAWFSWSNSRIVRTNRAAALVGAADLCVSAAGYNSFHEILYSGVPAVFVPQMTSFMDDQRARAQAAAERGLAAVVEAGQLMTLEREINRLLDGGGTELAGRAAALDLPAPGNAQAAALIEEVAIGHSTLDIGAWPDHRAGRG